VNRVLARSPRPALLDSFGPGLDESLSQATRLLITGVTRNTFVTSDYARLEGLLRRGCQIRFMLVDPDSAAAAAAASRYYAERSIGRVAERVRQTTRLLSELRRSTEGAISLRLTQQPLAMGVIAVDSPPRELTDASALFAEIYAYHTSTEPKFVLQPADTRWYGHFLAETEELWANATEFPLTSPDSAARSADPSGHRASHC
jgi:hypothetical protein